MAVVADVHADFSEPRLEHGITGVPRREIKFLPESRMTVRNVVLPVFSKVASIRVEDYCCVVKQSGHFDFINRHDQHHFVFLGQLLHAHERRPAGDALGQLVPFRILLRAEVRPIEKFLQAEDLHALLRRGRDHLFVLRDHFFFDVRQRIFLRRPFASSLDNTTTHDPRHRMPPGCSWEQVYYSSRGPTRMYARSASSRGSACSYRRFARCACKRAEYSRRNSPTPTWRRCSRASPQNPFRGRSRIVPRLRMAILG